MNKEKISNVFFICMFILFWIIILIFLCMNKNEYNLVDNRVAHKFEKIELKKFLSGEYQENMEISINDQLPKYNYFGIIYPKVSNYINYKSAISFNLHNKNKYVNLGNIYLYNNYLLYNSILDEDLKTFNSSIEKINYVIDNTLANIYLYYINSDNNIDFSNGKNIDVEKYLKENINLDNKNISSLKINNFEDYMKYFYKTDHHWNSVGTDTAYADILKMIGIDNKLNINKNICFDNKKFYGSKAKSIALDNLFKEEICVYEYNLPKFTITINREVVADYGNNIEVLTMANEMSYASIYGADYAEIIFDNNDNNSDKNLLIYSNSYSNSINKLLANHYDKTYVIDGRHNDTFDMVEYIKENKIDDVLILSNKMLFYDNITWGDF